MADIRLPARMQRRVVKSAHIPSQAGRGPALNIDQCNETSQPVIPSFTVSSLPRIVFGEGALTQVPVQAASLGKRVLIVTGGHSFRGSPYWGILTSGLRAQGVSWDVMPVEGEPSPQLVDDAVTAWRGAQIDVIVAVGGGSVLDAAKAVAGMLPHGNSVMDHLEGVGPEIPYKGPATPFIARAHDRRDR